MEDSVSESEQIMTDPDPGGPKNIRILLDRIRIHNTGVKYSSFN